MADGLRRIRQDLSRRRHVEVYVVAVASVVLAVLSLVGDVVADSIRWAVVFAALSLLTYQIALPARPTDLDDVLHSRESFAEITISSRLRRATEIWIFGPSATNLLTADTADHLRTSVLNRREGTVRMMVLDPSAHEAVKLAAHQLDDSATYPAADLHRVLPAMVDRIEMMAGWDVAGTYEHRLAPFNPGFSIVAINPYGKDGLLIVEFHGVHNESTPDRMHLELTRSNSEHWFVYWRNQFEQLWSYARLPEDSP